MLAEKLNVYIIIAFSLTLGILTDYLFYGIPIGISFFIFILAIIAFSLVIAKKFGQKLSKTQILILISAVIMSAEVFLRSISFLTFFNIIGSVYLLFLTAVLLADKDISSFRFFKYFTAPILFFLKSFSASLKFINEQKNLISYKEEFGSKNLRSIVKGIIMSLPILAILGWFLYSADMVVRAYADNFFNFFRFKINFELSLRILIIFIISCIFIGVFAKFAKKEKPEAPEEKTGPNKSGGFIESMTVLILVELLFLAFIAIQFFYLFGGKSYVWGIDEYITYSEYAKSGFYELIKVSIVSFLLIYAIDNSSKIETLKEKKIFRFLSAGLFIEISIILFSALKRILLYIDGYGLTLSRFLAFALLFWIFCVFLFFLRKIYLEKKNSVFISTVFALSVATWLGINILNPDALIAKINLRRFAEGKQIDPYYFSHLSDDAIPEIVKIFKLNASEEIKKQIATQLDLRYSKHGVQYCEIPVNTIIGSGYSECKTILFSDKIKKIEAGTHWQSYNLSKANAVAVLKVNANEIDKYQIAAWKNLAAECKTAADKCEKICATTAQIAPMDCKFTCNSNRCDELYK